jgi:hypothetical protein
MTKKEEREEGRGKKRGRPFFPYRFFPYLQINLIDILILEIRDKRTKSIVFNLIY